jgi:hypothetical protein
VATVFADGRQIVDAPAVIDSRRFQGKLSSSYRRAIDVRAAVNRRLMHLENLC